MTGVQTCALPIFRSCGCPGPAEHGRVAGFGVIFDWDGVVIDSSRAHERSWELLAEEVRRYTESRGATFVGWHPEAAEVLKSCAHPVLFVPDAVFLK